jgi:hypothetical protein
MNIELTEKELVRLRELVVENTASNIAEKLTDDLYNQFLDEFTDEKSELYSKIKSGLLTYVLSKPEELINIREMEQSVDWNDTFKDINFKELPAFNEAMNTLDFKEIMEEKVKGYFEYVDLDELIDLDELKEKITKKLKVSI